MENNQQIMEQNDVQQQTSQLKAKNDKLLHRLVALRVASYSTEWLGHFLLLLLFIGLGILGHDEIGLKWPVIIAIWVAQLLVTIFVYSISLPLGESRIKVTPTSTLRENLLRFSNNRRLIGMVSAVLCLSLGFWLASEVKSALNHEYWHYRFAAFLKGNPDLFSYAFYLILGIAVIACINSVTGILEVDRKINKVVAEMDELGA